MVAVIIDDSLAGMGGADEPIGIGPPLPTAPYPDNPASLVYNVVTYSNKLFKQAWKIQQLLSEVWLNMHQVGGSQGQCLQKLLGSKDSLCGSSNVQEFCCALRCNAIHYFL